MWHPVTAVGVASAVAAVFEDADVLVVVTDGTEVSAYVDHGVSVPSGR